MRGVLNLSSLPSYVVGSPEADLDARICVQVISYGSALRRKWWGSGGREIGRSMTAGEFWSVSCLSAFVLPWRTGPGLSCSCGPELLTRDCLGAGGVLGPVGFLCMWLKWLYASKDIFWTKSQVQAITSRSTPKLGTRVHRSSKRDPNFYHIISSPMCLPCGTFHLLLPNTIWRKEPWEYILTPYPIKGPWSYV